MKVVAIERGYYRRRRREGDVFDVHFSLDAVMKSKWMRPLGQKPPQREIPSSRDAAMVDVLKGIPAAQPEPETMSEMTAQILEEEAANPKFMGVPVAAEPQKRGPGRPKGSKNKTEATP